MKMQPSLEQAFCAQITLEFEASLVYRQLAIEMDAIALPGMAAWLRHQADEEIVHANKFIDHLLDRDNHPVIGAIPFSLLTDHLTLDLPTFEGRWVADPARDLLKLCVLERHGVNGNIGRGFVRGFGPMGGAIASTVGHDSHNITVAGSDDADMAAAVNHLVAIQGGAAVVRGGRVLADWGWRERPVAVVAMPSRSRPLLVDSLARGIAKVGRLPYLGALAPAGGGPTGQPGGNSAFRLAGVWERLTVDPELAHQLPGLTGPVLLVDDVVHSRWTMTTAARALRRAGSQEVLPFALAVDG